MRIWCTDCGIEWEFEGYEIVLEPWPHAICPKCGKWLAAF